MGILRNVLRYLLSPVPSGVEIQLISITMKLGIVDHIWRGKDSQRPLCDEVKKLKI